MNDLMKCCGCDQEKPLREFRRSFLGYPICIMCESKLDTVAQAVAVPIWLEPLPERTGPMTPAENGRKALIDHLRSTGTGYGKLVVAAQADVSKCETELDGATATLEHMRKSGFGEGTLAKARAFIDKPSWDGTPTPAEDVRKAVEDFRKPKGAKA